MCIAVQGYSIVLTPLFPESAGNVYAYATDNDNAYFATPNVRREVQKHFGCDQTPGALIDFEPSTSHFDSEVLRVRAFALCCSCLLGGGVMRYVMQAFRNKAQRGGNNCWRGQIAARLAMNTENLTQVLTACSLSLQPLSMPMAPRPDSRASCSTSLHVDA